MKRIPIATYRLQFNRDFTFRQANNILDYLRELGISDVYASPLLCASPQSTHGYDTCSFDKLNPNLGSAEDFERFTGSLKNRDLGLLLDVVPNHMSATGSNPWWMDVLENGRESAYADFFDIDWHSDNPALRDKVLLPVLEDHYGKVLESGKLRFNFHEGNFFISYYDRNFPIDRNTLPADAFKNGPALSSELNGTPGNARSFDKLDELLQRQHYRLAFWRVASEEINYRRFFDVTEMVALRMEVPEVFRETHALIFEWLAAGKVTGLRIDHPDGLWNPKEYLERLQARVAEHKPSEEKRPLYLLVEKILCGNEQLPLDWPTDGTTGYDFLNRVNGVFVDEFNALAIDEIYRKFTDNDTSFEEIVYRSRKHVLELSFRSELNRLTRRLREVAGGNRNGRDFTFSQLREALGEVIASFPVYRTYITETSETVSDIDRKVIQLAVNKARKRSRSQSDASLFEWLEQLLLLEVSREGDAAGLKKVREFVMKFQQLTGPAMAKGLEDTAFYRFNRLLSLNEVGGEPGKFGVGTDEFHQANSVATTNWPHTLLATATHDTKRGEDVRARLNVLSEMPVQWHESLSNWSGLNMKGKTTIGNTLAPDPNDEYLLYQTLVGAWPADGGTADGIKAFRSRVSAFMLKAAKEAKVHTSWTEPNAEYEKSLQDFVDHVLAEKGNEIFLDDIKRFVRRVAFFGRFNSLSQTLLKIASPGVPDFYQGCDLWDLSLVDPDNRRPVDYALRQNLLADLRKKFKDGQEGSRGLFDELLQEEKIGTMKLFLVWRALQFRREQRDVFEAGTYVALSAEGEKQKHLCAFARQWRDRSVIAVAPRLIFGLTRGMELPPIGVELWKDTVLPVPGGNSFRNALTGESVVAVERDGKAFLEVGQILKSFPAALLEQKNS